MLAKCFLRVSPFFVTHCTPPHKMIAREIKRQISPPHSKEDFAMNNNCLGNLFGGGDSCCWIIIIALIVLCCCCH